MATVKADIDNSAANGAAASTAPERSLSVWAAVVLFGLLILSWGGNYTWMKLAVRDIGVWQFNTLRYTGAVAMIGALLAAQGGWRNVLPPRGERLALGVIGLLQIGILSALITGAVVFIEASRAVLVVYTNPIWTLLLSIAFLGERVTWNRVLGLGLGIAGLVILTNPAAMEWTPRALIGVGLALAGTLVWACGSVAYKMRRWKATYGQQIFMQLAACLVASVPFTLWLDADTPIHPTETLSLILLWNMIGPTTLAYAIWATLLSRISPANATQVLLLSPIYGMLQSHLVLGEPLGLAILAAAACVVCGALLTFWRPRRRG